ncbi:TetR/AcrR family transcriptional regulator [Streptomyces sp. NPDC048278]|uniref:TetR/AcrR family transcriptional regulator n=1 Tax=Streptomyces sp. NPDC048278 TaxID=3155809 RepID=UPI00342EDAF5
MTPAPRPQPLPPRQARSVLTYQRILNAATAILAERGWDAFTIDAVGQAADVSVGNIYRRFGDKDGLFTAVHTAHLERMRAAGRQAFAPEAWPDLPPQDGVAETVRRLGRQFQDHAPLDGVLILHSNKVSGLGEEGALFVSERRSMVEQMLFHYYGPDTTVRVMVCYRLAFATFMDFGTFNVHPTQQPEMTWETLIEEVAHACVRYLFASEAPMNRAGSLTP